MVITYFSLARYSVPMPLVVDSVRGRGNGRIGISRPTKGQDRIASSGSGVASDVGSINFEGLRLVQIQLWS